MCFNEEPCGVALRKVVELLLVFQHRSDHVVPSLPFREGNQCRVRTRRHRRRIIVELIVSAYNVHQEHGDEWHAWPFHGLKKGAISREAPCGLIIFEQTVQNRPPTDVSPSEVEAGDDGAGKRSDERTH